MSTRPLDWSPLAGSDPVPGDPDMVAEAARRYRRTASAISTAASNLRKLADGELGWSGQAGPEIRERAGEVAKEVERAHDRYSEAADALGLYAPELEDAQRIADQALRDAQDAEADQDRASSRASSVQDPTGTGAQELRQHESAAAAAGDRLAAARRALERATAKRDRAAERAAGALEDAAEHAHDSLWDKVAKILAAIGDAAGVIATICGVLSLLVGWIPVIGQALAAILGTVALIASAIALVCHLALLIGGKGSVKDVLLDVLSVATFGLGRVFSGAARLSSIAARSRAWTAANAVVRTRMPALNSAARRLQVQALVGLRRGASPAAVGRAPAGVLRGTGGLPAAYGGVFRGLRDSVRSAWRGRTSLPGWGTGPAAVVRETLRKAGTEFGTAAQLGGGRAVLDHVYAARELGLELARLRTIDVARMADDVTARLLDDVLSTASVQSAMRQAVVQDRIRVGAMLTGSGSDFYQGGEKVVEALRGDPDVTGTAPAPGSLR